MKPKLKLFAPRRSAKSRSRAASRRGAEHGRRWGATADPAEIGRVSAALADCAALAGDRAIDAAPGIGGLLLLARLAFLIRPELLAADLDAAMAAAVEFWREVLGDAYHTTMFDDHTEAGAWMMGFAAGAIEGCERARG